MVNDIKKTIIILEQVLSRLEKDIRKKYQGNPNDISELIVRLDRAIKILLKIK